MKWTLFMLVLGLAACGSCGDEEPQGVPVDDIREEQDAPMTTPCGGCTLDGECLDGDADDACGLGGQACVECSGGDMCVDGACTDATTDEPCSADNCDGCCNDQGRCVAGGQESACGAGGSQCSACAANEQCTDGICVDPAAPSCGPASCNGCCDAAGACQGGAAAAACGLGGGSCSDCSATGATCQAGACAATPPACADTCAGCCVGETCITATTPQQCGAGGGMCLACGADETCTNGLCMAQPVPTGDLWNLVLVSAEIAPTKRNGQAWDSFGGDPDPYMYMYAEDNVALYYWEYESGLFIDEYAPVWNELMFIQITSQALSEGVFFNLIDDEAGPDDICLQVEVVTDPAAVANRDMVTTCRADPRTTWTWRIEPAP